MGEIIVACHRYDQSVLHEVQKKVRSDQSGYQENEEQPADDTGHMSQMWNKSTNVHSQQLMSKVQPSQIMKYKPISNVVDLTILPGI